MGRPRRDPVRRRARQAQGRLLGLGVDPAPDRAARLTAATTGRPWAVVQHVAYEGPGLIGDAARRRGLELDVRRMDRGDALPDARELGGLVVMGGPMGVGDVGEHPHLAGELELIATAEGLGLPILGVCLGAQLLAAALGANVYRGPVAEIGLGSVALTADGRRNPVLGAAGVEELPVLHWHQDTFDLPHGAIRLASSAQYPNQAFRTGRCAYGLQFHVELTAELARSMADHLPEDVALPAAGRQAVEQVGTRIVAAFFDTALARRAA